MSEYETQANAFLAKFRLEIRAAHKDAKCPPFCDGKHVHGDRYRVTIKRIGRARVVAEWTDAGRVEKLGTNSVSFDFWNSYNAMQNGEDLTNYDVLSCVSSDATCPLSAKEVCEEFGYNADSRKDWATAHRVAAFAKKLQAFFTRDEIEALGEIQ